MPARKCRRAGEQSGGCRGPPAESCPAAAGLPAAPRARCELAAAAGGEPALGEGAAGGGGLGCSRTDAASPPRGVPPHCEPANRRAEVGRAGRADAAVVQLAQHPGSDRSDLGSGGSRGVSVTQKTVELPRRVDRPMPPPIAPHLTGFPFPPILIGKRGGRGRPNVRVSPWSDRRCRCYTESRL